MEVLNSKKIQAMISLLGDRSVKVRNRVAHSLESHLTVYKEELENAIKTESDPLIRERLNLLIQLGSSTRVEEHWQILKDQMAFNVRDGMVAISLMDIDAKVERLDLLRQMNDLSDEWLSQITKHMSNEEKVKSLMEFLFRSGRFKGNGDDYYSLDNCFLHRIFEHGKGLPVTLCLLAVMLAEEADLPLYGIGLPLHFIVGHFQGSKGISFYDCFDGGREVSPEECVNYLHSRGIFFHPQLLSPCDSESILQRVIVNIKHIAQRKGMEGLLSEIEKVNEIENIEAL